ncbi:coproporphyrinogen III oxidase [Vibrio sp. MACH09]|uniref:DUF2489 domain-containing protein n=1 Tax=unclassified Vibrio TaxID=2614977 RepID=UPI00149387FD|nr:MULTISPECIES: DUF2489 domain-containing protein [unclassified Vibrio]NOI68500.1 DUF2489 domain-containing protein [Vibrio sp. 99-8-1]GLO59541.1 coproporphyrinogen III oxidase [Vibrio sp. MACH09]
MDVTLLLIVAVVIVLGLAFYAGSLLLKVRQQKQLQQQVMDLAVAKRNANIFESVNTLCLAGIQGQCDLSELSIRVYCILDYVQGEHRIDVEKTYPALSELYQQVKDMARGDARQELPKQVRMRETLDRQKAEARLNDDIIVELKQLQQHIQPLSKGPSDTITATR